MCYENRAYNCRSKTAPGGLAVFCKWNLSNIFVPLQRNSKDILWVKLKKELTGLQEDVYLGTIYHSPSSNKQETQNNYHELTNDILFFQDKGLVILQGDFNAITNEEPDFIINNKFSNDLDLDNYPTVPTRNSEDKRETNLRGGRNVGTM